MSPHLIDVEVLAAWRRLTSAGELDARRADLAIADLRALRLRRVPHQPLLERCWSLRSNLTMYDATYVALAEMTGSVLVTADSRLPTSSGPRCEIEVLA
jgi:predicted nucleic acid-binding protein